MPVALLSGPRGFELVYRHKGFAIAPAGSFARWRSFATIC